MTPSRSYCFTSRRRKTWQQIEKFSDFVKRQRAETPPEDKFDAVKELANWLGTLNQLYTTIESYLETHVSAGDIRMSIRTLNSTKNFPGRTKLVR